LKDEIENKNQFSKRKKFKKNEDQNWHKNKNNVVINGIIEKDNNFYKKVKKKNYKSKQWGWNWKT
jgi:hypothetical protein